MGVHSSPGSRTCTEHDPKSRNKMGDGDRGQVDLNAQSCLDSKIRITIQRSFPPRRIVRSGIH